MTLVDLLIEGLTATVSGKEDGASTSLPYPMPGALVTPREIVLRELEACLPPDGDGPMTVTRVLGSVRPYRVEVRLLRHRGEFEFTDAACALLAIGALT